MPSYESIIYRCVNLSCLHEEEALIERYWRDVPETCPKCSDNMFRKITANVMRASFPDGTKRDGWSVARERRAIDREIRQYKIDQRRNGINETNAKEIARRKQEKEKIKK